MKPVTWMSIITAVCMLAACTEEIGANLEQAGVQTLATLNPPSSANVQASFVLLTASAGKPVAYARVIQDDGFACPQVAADCTGGITQPMTARDKPWADAAAHCPAGGCFPVTVCEASVPFNQKTQVCLNGPPIELPVPRSGPAKILVMGDTGCKDGSHTGDGGGDCGHKGNLTELAQPFETLVSSNARTAFELVLHMGDYNYRGTPGSVRWQREGGGKTTHHPYDAGDGAPSCGQSPSDRFRTQASSRSLLPDQWDIWRKDFFAPAKPLLAAAPWVFARGNHELCSRAGPGYFYFLDAGFKPAGTQVDCPALPSGNDHPSNPFLYSRVSPMARIDLDTLSLIVLDSANACDTSVPAPGNHFRTAYENQFQQLVVPKTGTTWIMSHRPIWKNQTLQATSNDGKALDGIALSLAGHEHLFESITPTGSSYPAEIVAGNGGVSLGGDFDGCFQQPLAGQQPWVQGVTGHGFLQLALTTSGSGQPGWSGRLIDESGKTTAKCDSAMSPSICTTTPPGARCQ